MQRNGSPKAIFSTDESRSHFLVTLPIHPEMQVGVGKTGTDPIVVPSADWIDQLAMAVGHVLTERQREILKILASQKELSFGDIFKRLAGTPVRRTIQNELQRLNEVGLVHSTGKQRWTKWSILRQK